MSLRYEYEMVTSWTNTSWRLAKLPYEYEFIDGPITACGMLVRMDFGPAVELYNTPCVVSVRAGERTLATKRSVF